MTEVLKPLAEGGTLRPAHPLPRLGDLLRPSPQPASAALLGTPGLELTFNARGALLQAFGEIAATTPRRQVLLPGFHCPSAVTPALMAGFEPVYYRIRADLSVDWDDVVAKTGDATAALLLIHFFGDPPRTDGLAALRARSVRIVEDCSHSFYTTDPLRLAGSTESDYRIYSFWKIVASGVGGGLWRHPTLAVPTHARTPARRSASLRNVKRLVEEAVTTGDHPWLAGVLHTVDGVRRRMRGGNNSQQAIAASLPSAAAPSLEHGESYYPVDRGLAAAAMPAHVRRMLAAADLSGIAARRRKNAMVYRSAMPQLGPLLALPAAAQPHGCPWVFPVLLEQRDRRDRGLRAAGVALHTFGIYLHSSLFSAGDAHTVAAARFLAERLLCLSVHQDLGTADIEAACGVIQAQARTWEVSTREVPAP